jgi:hypothetical protein
MVTAHLQNAWSYPLPDDCGVMISHKDFICGQKAMLQASQTATGVPYNCAVCFKLPPVFLNVYLATVI